MLEVTQKLTHKIILLCSIFITVTSPVLAAEKLIFAIDVIRHGDRSPLLNIPKSPHKFAIPNGELTPLGMQQQYELGKKFRALYIDKHKLLPEKFDVRSLHVRSTDYNRTLMSAQSLLLGLYPLGTGPVLENSKSALPENFQPIPIHTVSDMQDRLLQYGNAPEFENMRKKYVYSSIEYHHLMMEYQDNYNRWSDITGLDCSDAYVIVPLGDHLLIRKEQGIPMPEGMTDADVDNIVNFSNKLLWIKFKPKEIGLYLSEEFRGHVTELFENAITKKTELKYALFSAHDATILGIMSGFGAPMIEVPPLASDLKILLLEDGGKKIVRLSLNDKAIKLPGCSKEKCTLEEFNAVLKAE